MSYVTPYATYKVVSRSVTPGVELLQNVEVTLAANNRCIKLGDIIHIPSLHGSIENHVMKLVS